MKSGEEYKYETPRNVASSFCACFVRTCNRAELDGEPIRVERPRVRSCASVMGSLRSVVGTSMSSHARSRGNFSLVIRLWLELFMTPDVTSSERAVEISVFCF
jgi:hypothetical protein